MSSSGDLARAIRSVVHHEVFVDRGVTKALVPASRRAPRQAAGGALGRLSAREREVLALTAAGHTSTEIGTQLDVSPKTVETYRSRMMEKLGFKHRSELVRFALRTGLLRVEYVADIWYSKRVSPTHTGA